MEVIDTSDPKADSPEMRKAISDEIHYLVNSGTFRVTSSHELPDGANTLTASVVLAIKSKADSTVRDTGTILNTTLFTRLNRCNILQLS